MLLSNQVARFFDQQYLCKESSDILRHIVGTQDYYFLLDVARCTQPRSKMPRLVRVPLIGLGSMARLRVVHNERFSYNKTKAFFL